MVYRNIVSGIIQPVKPNSTVYLMEAAFLGNIAFIQFYIEHNGDINVTDSKGRNALHLACMCDNKEVTKFLLLNGIKVDLKEKINEQTPLFLSIKYRSYKAMKLIVNYGCQTTTQE
jgi:ankyrin repeat protein